jgi:hypothetical protein
LLQQSVSARTCVLNGCASIMFSQKSICSS